MGFHKSETHAAATTIPRRPTLGSPLDYHDLRAQGIAHCQALSGEHWTDYNLHDPGVTLLESFCYALTEIPFLAEARIEDLLADRNGNLDLGRFGLHPPLRAFPTRPLTIEDYRRVLLDLIPTLDDVYIEYCAVGILAIELRSATRAPEEADIVDRVRNVYWRQRNLGEDLVPALRVERGWPCMLEAEFVLSGPRDPVDVIEECYVVAAQFISGRPPRRSLIEHVRHAEESGETLAQCLEGPMLFREWMTPLDPADNQTLFFADLGRKLQEIDGIVEVHDLVLRAQGGESSSTSIRLHGDDGRLQLQWPSRLEDLAKIRVRRRSIDIPLPIDRLLLRLVDQRGARRKQYNEVQHDLDAPKSPDPTAMYREAHWLGSRTHYAALNHLPPIFHEPQIIKQHATQPGEHEQFLAYLALFEQAIANATAQCRFVSELYSADASDDSSYCPQILDNRQLPGIDRLYLEPLSQVRRDVFESADPALDRRSRALDLLLALHGESFASNALRGFGWYFDVVDWEPHIFGQKQRFLESVVHLTQDRASAIDYSQPSFGHPGNTAACQERVSLLLGFKTHYSRSLSAAWRSLGLTGPAAGQWRERYASLEPPVRDLPLVPLDGRETLQGEFEWLLLHVPALRHSSVPLPFLRCAVHADRYRVTHDDKRVNVWLGPDEDHNYWLVTDSARLSIGAGERTGPATVEHAIQRLRSFACRLMFASEGMHVIENILLRPSDYEESEKVSDVPDDFYAHRISFVFSGWTTRGKDSSFRSFAEHTVELNTPAHLMPVCLWLELDELYALESGWRAWLAARMERCARPSDPLAIDKLDDAASLLRRLLVRIEKRREPNGKRTTQESRQ